MNEMEFQITEKKNPTAFYQIQEGKFDVGLVNILPFQQNILKVFGIPLVKTNNFFVNGVYEAITFQPYLGMTTPLSAF